jgi:hypothetical protein
MPPQRVVILLALMWFLHYLLIKVDKEVIADGMAAMGSA